MTKREAVIKTINRQNPAYIPWQLDLTIGISEKLQEYYKTEDFLYSCVENHLVREKYKNHPDEYRIFELGFSLYERSWSLRGMSDLLSDFLLEPDFVNDLIKHLLDYNLEVIKAACKYEIMGELIDMGLDVYNTFQPEVYDIQKFKSEFGKDITIYGGISTQ